MCSALYTVNLNLVGIFEGGGGGDLFRIIYLRGDVFRIIHRKFKFGGDIWEGGFVPYYIPEGGCVPYLFPDRRFYSGLPILHFIYFINLMRLLIGQK